MDTREILEKVRDGNMAVEEAEQVFRQIGRASCRERV